MEVFTNNGLLRIGIVATQRRGRAAMFDYLARFHQYLGASGFTHALHFGSDSRGVAGFDITGDQTSWTPLTHPVLDIIGPDGTTMPCRLVTDPSGIQFRRRLEGDGVDSGIDGASASATLSATAATPGAVASATATVTASITASVIPDSLFLYGGCRECDAQRHGHACLIRSGSRFYGTYMTAAILTLPIGPGGRIDCGEAQLRLWWPRHRERY